MYDNSTSVNGHVTQAQTADLPLSRKVPSRQELKAESATHIPMQMKTSSSALVTCCARTKAQLSESETASGRQAVNPLQHFVVMPLRAQLEHGACRPESRFNRMLSA